ncbi:MAG: class I SAM-dependent methyltransferase [Paludibacteraceae bacterium]
MKETISIDKIGYLKNSRPEMKALIPESAKNILEVGCSDGSFCASLKNEERDIWGIEYNPETTQKAKNSCNHLLIGDINELYKDLPKGYFDCIVFNDVLEHLYSPWEVLLKLKEFLAPNGLIISSIPNFRYIDNMIKEILWQGDFRYRPEGGILDDTHIRFFTSKSILRMYNEQGYEILVHKGIRPCKSWKENLFINLTFGLLKDARYKQFATVATPRK